MLPFLPPNKPVLEPSHDVDHIRKTWLLRFKQTAFNIFNVARVIRKPRAAFEKLSRSAAFLLSTPSYWCFPYWLELEDLLEAKSVFYIFAKARRADAGSFLFDPTYDLTSNHVLRDQLRSMIKDGHVIGLHGSYRSATDPGLLAQEKELLEEAIGTPVEHSRQHWLNFNEEITPYAHERNFFYDSTIGFNDAIGFRAGCASRYHPYDHRNQRPFDYLVTPFVVMDSTLFDYSATDRDSLAEASAMIENLRSLPNAHVSMCWHQRVRASDYSWHGAYEMLLRQAHGSFHLSPRP